jgi:electron transport complex protein RnfA
LSLDVVATRPTGVSFDDFALAAFRDPFRERARHIRLVARPEPEESMTEYALILIGTVLVNNFVLVKFLGLCPFMGVSKKLETAAGMGLATTFVLTLSSVTSWLVNQYLLVPLGIEYLRIIAFILVIAAVVQFTETIMRKTSPLLYQVLGIFLPLITTNCAVLGVALLNLQAEHTLVEATLYGFGAAVGFSLVLTLFAAMRERVAVGDVPEPFQGSAIALVTAGLMSLAFMGFAGLVAN